MLRPRSCGDGMHGLTERRRAVLHLADRGMDDPAIAAELRVGISTVLSHWHAIYDVLRVEKGDHRRGRALCTWRMLGRVAADKG